MGNSFGLEFGKHYHDGAQDVKKFFLGEIFALGLAHGKTFPYVLDQIALTELGKQEDLLM